MKLQENLQAYLLQHQEEAPQRLLAWFARHARDLPWRRDRTPYRVWIAEVMLQQTQVKTVEVYYRRFMARFPSVEALAQASQEDVLRVWEGLGYYRRARMLHQAARELVRRHQGRLPSDVKALRALPGIGAYTAGAIASIAFGLPVPAVDGNVRRVMSRVLAISEPSTRTLEEAVCLWIPAETPGSFTEALMELGATLCLPRAPLCVSCPWQDLCRAYQGGEPEAYPQRRSRKALPHYDVAAAVILRPTIATPQQVLVARRLAGAMLGGLWEFPGGKREPGETLPETLQRELQEELAITVEARQLLTVIQHAYTHFRITLHAFIAELIAGEPRCLECQDFRWVVPSELADLPMAVTDRRITHALKQWLADRTAQPVHHCGGEGR